MASSFAQSGQNAGTEALVQEIQGLLNVLENHGLHFEEQVILLEQGRKDLAAWVPWTNRNGGQGRPKAM